MKKIINDKQLIRYCQMSINQENPFFDCDAIKLFFYFMDYYDDLISEDYNKIRKIPLSILFFVMIPASAIDTKKIDVDTITKEFPKYSKYIDNLKPKDLESIKLLIRANYERNKYGRYTEKNIDLLDMEQKYLKNLHLDKLNEVFDVAKTFDYAFSLLSIIIVINHSIKSDSTIKSIMTSDKEMLTKLKNIVEVFHNTYEEAISYKKIADDNYTYLKELFRTGKINEVTDFKTIKEHETYIDYIVLHYAYKRINQNIEKQYDEYIEKNKELENEGKLGEIDELLLSYHLPLKTLTPNKKELLNKKNNINLIKDTISLLTPLSFTPVNIFKTNLFFVILDITEDNLKYIHSLLKNKIINPDFIKDNLGILLSSVSDNNPYKPLLNQIKSNIDLLKKSKFPFNNINYDPKILLFNKKDLENNIKILSEYDLKADNYTYLIANIDKLPCLDLMIENKIPLYLLRTICETENYLLTISKIILCMSLSITFLDHRGLLLPFIYKTGNFFVKDKDIDDYLLNENNIYINDILPPKEISDNYTGFLEERYNPENKCYEFNLCSISKNKFLRNYSNGNSVINSLLANSILSYDMIDDIMTSLSNQFEDEVKKQYINN